jgi:hypothetical protein
MIGSGKKLDEPKEKDEKITKKQALWKKINDETYSTGDIIEHKNVNVKIEKERWNVIITITDRVGNKIAEYIATADGFYAEGDIWFGTRFAFDKIYELEG